MLSTIRLNELPIFDLSLNTNEKKLLTTAFKHEINGKIFAAKNTYSQLTSNLEAQAHLKRISEDTNLPFTKQLLNMATVAEQHGNLLGALDVYSELLLQSTDQEAYDFALNRSTALGTMGYIVAEK